jgi:hypothetical protein
MKDVAERILPGRRSVALSRCGAMQNRRRVQRLRRLLRVLDMRAAFRVAVLRGGRARGLGGGRSRYRVGCQPATFEKRWLETRSLSRQTL